KMIVETFLMMPLVLPPTVVGFLLLVVFGKHSVIGRAIEWIFHQPVIFTWWAAVIASTVVAFPLMYQSAKAGFSTIESDDQDVTYAYDLGNKQDKYGRELCYVFVEGTLVQKDLIERGYAIVRYAEAPNTTYLEELKNAEKIAKEQHFGVWGIDDYV
ncbi:thermonuclease family protein, partial [Listeria monocytogenes]|uniref:thermonuclease family protein n=1 Tax=Listeria monocytogenes TaxID=1639 RepID=UPI003D33EE8C